MPSCSDRSVLAPWVVRLALGVTVAAPQLAHAEDEAPPLSIYGTARLDVLADDSRMSDLVQPLFVLREPSTGKLDGELTMTPRQSRVGLGIDAWELDERGHMIGEGKLEIDFGGGAGTGVIRLRHAYATITMFRKVEILAGQTWDLISPLAPTVQEDTLLAFAGNTGGRRPQLRLSALVDQKVRISVAAAATGTLDQRDLDGDGQVDGMAAGTPMIQGLIELTQRMFGPEPLRVGVWGHAAREELADGTRYPAWSTGMHAVLPLGRAMTWSGEAYTGNNLADIGGGVGQGVGMTGKTIHAVGGWFEAALKPTQRHTLAFGLSGDYARASDLMPGERRANGTMYGAIRYLPKPSLQLGLEYLYWRTQYQEMSAGVANRFDAHLSVLF